MSGNAMSQSLNYANLKRKAVSARSFRANIQSRSGNTFQGGQSMTFQLPTAARQFADLTNAYLSMTLYHPDGTLAANRGYMDVNAYSIFDRITTSAAGGAVIEDITSVAKYYQSVLSQSLSDNNTQNVAQISYGSFGDPRHKYLGTLMPSGRAQSITVNLPLFHGIFSADKMIPLDTNSSLEFQFYLNQADDFLYRSTNGNAVANYIVEAPTLIVPIVEISSEAALMLDQSVGDLGYNISFTGVAHTQDVRAANQTSVVSNLPFRYSSLEKITVLHFDQDTKNDQDFTQSNRSQAAMTEFSVKIGGQRYPQVPVQMDGNNLGEALNETLLSMNLLGDMYHNTNLNMLAPISVDANGLPDNAVANIRNAINFLSTTPGVNKENYRVASGVLTATGADQIAVNDTQGEYGQFLLSLSLESFKNPVSEGGLYSGLSTIGSTVLSQINYDPQNRAMDIHYYANYSAVLSLDRETLTWNISN